MQQTRKVAVRDAKTSIRQVIIMSGTDAEYLLHPTTGERNVIDHYEHRTVFRRDSYGNEEPYDVQVPIYRHGNYKISQEDDLQFMKALRDLENRYGTTFPIRRYDLSIGGAVIELENGMVFETSKGASVKGWSTGDEVIVKEHPTLELPSVVLVHESTGKALGGQVLASHQ
jgi:hypothetical protein